MYSSNRTGDVTINYRELKALLMQLLLFALRIVPLSHIHTNVNTMATHGWANMGSVSTSSSVRLGG